MNLDGAGAARVTLPGLPAADSPQEINAELEYSDPNGEVLTTSTRVPLWPSKILLGIKPDAWTLSKDELKFQVLALDLSGKPVKQQQVDVQLYVRNMFSHRKRLIGGFYGYESGAEVRKLDSACQGKTDDKGRLFCTVKPPVSGNIVMGAVAKDKDGNLSYANASAWMAGNEAWWFDQANDDRMDVIPERKRYEPGQTAQFQVRMPFRQATALVTVEREGVIDSFVQQLSGNAPVIKVPLKGNYAPNVFVSVLVVRGRVSDVKPTALVDLGQAGVQDGHRRKSASAGACMNSGSRYRRQGNLQGTRQGARVGAGHATCHRKSAEAEQRGRHSGRRRRAAGVAAERFLETAGGDDAAARLSR